MLRYPITVVWGPRAGSLAPQSRLVRKRVPIGCPHITPHQGPNTLISIRALRTTQYLTRQRSSMASFLGFGRGSVRASKAKAVDSSVKLPHVAEAKAKAYS